MNYAIDFILLLLLLFRIKAQDQWDKLRMSILKCGVDVKIIDPVQGLPDMVFCCNSAIVNENKVRAVRVV